MACACSTSDGILPRFVEFPSTMALNVLSFAFGLVLIVGALNDVFQSVIVPRAVGRGYRVSFLLWRGLWFVWPRLSWKLYPRNGDLREDFLAIFAPFTLIALLMLWAAMLITGYGFVLFALRDGISPPVHSLGAATYLSGTSFTTIGFGDFVGKSTATRLVSICAAVSGLTLFAITTAYLFALFGSFQARETFVVMVGARAGAPPNGVNLLAIAAYSQTRNGLNPLMFDAQRWAASVMESHLAYPVLGFFRSSHDNESWIGTLGTLLDAATLLMTTAEGEDAGQARIFYNIGRHAANDLANYFRTIAPSESPGVERSEFDRACDRLAAAGYTLRDRDEAWQGFSGLRKSYAPHLNALARFFLIPPLQWIGDRSTLTKHPSSH